MRKARRRSVPRRAPRRRLSMWGWGFVVLVPLLILTFFFMRNRSYQLVIEGGQEVSVEVHETYEDLGATLMHKGKEKETIKAKGEVDTTTLGDYTLTYKYTSFLIHKKVERVVHVTDTTAPELKLASGDISIKLGRVFREPGYAALDNFDGDISDQVVVEGSVDSSTEGSYELTYTITDSSGNISTLKRLVHVAEVVELVGKVPEKGPSAGIIFLTFDDGPNGEYSEDVLDILKSEGVKATFFVVGRGPDEVIKRTYAEGHELALHTFSHDYENIYSSDANYFSDLYKIQDRVKRLTGHTSTLIRFPGGTSNSISRNYNKGIMTRLSKDVEAKGFKYFDWNVDSGDASNSVDGDYVYNNTVNQLSKYRSNVILMHDTHAHTVDALPRIIQYAKKNGYTFEVISKLEGTVHHGANN